uniref:HDC06323 n=1 Tax=Drosophila melanogaster TaxID=7227 RepID=Q6IGG6_DROME|nr:TPA_inf: HDC06323 [Drosophila melanogaster]
MGGMEFASLQLSLQLYFVILDDLLVITFVALLKFQALRNVRITLDASKIQCYT